MPAALNLKKLLDRKQLAIRSRGVLEVRGPLFGASADSNVWSAGFFEQKFQIRCSRSVGLEVGELRIATNLDELGEATLISYQVDGQETIDPSGVGHSIRLFSPEAANASKKLFKAPQKDQDVFITLSTPVPPAVDVYIIIELVEPTVENEFRIFADMLALARTALQRSFKKAIHHSRKQIAKKKRGIRAKLKNLARGIWRRLPFVKGVGALEDDPVFLGALEEGSDLLATQFSDNVLGATNDMLSEILGRMVDEFPRQLTTVVGDYWDQEEEKGTLGAYNSPSAMVFSGPDEDEWRSFLGAFGGDIDEDDDDDDMDMAA